MRRNDAFGKLERCASKGETTNWLPLLDHLVDVAYCVERICRCNSVRRALTSAAQRELDGADLARLAVIALLHDIGKASSSFQSKRWAAGQRPGYWPNPSGHGAQAIYLFQDDEKVAHLLDALPVQEMVNWGAALIPLLYASFSHHGRPLLENQATLSQVSRKDWQPVTDHTSTLVYAPLPVLEAISGRARELFSAAFGSVERPLPNNRAFAHLFAGLVQFADWLGSDTRHFPIRIDADRGESAKQYADQAIAALGLDSTASRNHLLNTHPSFQQAFDVPAPHPIQAGMADDALGQLVILESETGSGKTEAALWRFIHLFQRGEVDSLYFALPTRVSAKQVYDRVRKAVDRLWAENRPSCCVPFRVTAPLMGRNRACCPTSPCNGTITPMMTRRFAAGLPRHLSVFLLHPSPWVPSTKHCSEFSRSSTPTCGMHYWPAACLWSTRYTPPTRT